MLRKSTFTIVIILLAVTAIDAQVPQLINYQGMLTDADGNPITGSRSIQFKIYDSEQGGNAVWSETQTATVTDGIFSVLLGSTTPIPFSIFDGNDKYLSLQVESDPEMAPRKRLVSVGYALRAYDADKFDGKDASEFATKLVLSTPDGNPPNEGSNQVSWDNLKDVPTGFADGVDDKSAGGGDDLGDHRAMVNIQLLGNWLSGDGDDEGVYVDNNGNVGIGTSNPAYKLDVNGRVYGKDDGTGNYGYLGGDAGAFGANTSANTSGKLGHDKYGAYGESTAPGMSPDKWGYVGGKYYGAFGMDSTAEKYGGLGSEDYGAFGVDRPSNNWGFLGGGSDGAYGANNNGNWGRLGGVKAGAFGGNSNGNYGGLGYFLGGAGGGHIENDEVRNFGWLGYDDGNVSYGLYAQHGNNSGYIGGINYAGYFTGDVHVTGTISKGGGSFVIDHPLDPENKYLSHSFVESPDMKNVYDGVVELNASGEAMVELPEWFEALNENFRYQLTAIGAPAPNLHIAEKISNNRFKIAGGNPGMEVSWQVTGIRHDAFARANRIEVEMDKPDTERGKYLHPKEHGMPESMGVGYEQRQEMRKSMKTMKPEIEKMETMRKRPGVK